MIVLGIHRPKSGDGFLQRARSCGQLPSMLFFKYSRLRVVLNTYPLTIVTSNESVREHGVDFVILQVVIPVFSAAHGAVSGGAIICSS